MADESEPNDMRTQEKNPMWRSFKNYLPTSGLYPARWVDIFSNTDKKLRYRDVEVVFVPRGTDGPEISRELWDEFALYNRKWLGDLGNSVDGWMEQGGWRPEHIFGFMLDRGFVSQGELETAIKEFAHIEECQWARDMRDGRLMKDVLVMGARDRDATIAALRKESARTASEWSKNMLKAVEGDQ